MSASAFAVNGYFLDRTLGDFLRAIKRILLPVHFRGMALALFKNVENDTHTLRYVEFSGHSVIDLANKQPRGLEHPPT